MTLRRILTGVMTAVAALTITAAVAPAAQAAAPHCPVANRVCLWADAGYSGYSAVYQGGVQVLPTSLDHRISSVSVASGTTWVFYSEKYYVHPVFCIGAGIEIANLQPWGHNDQFRSMKPLTGLCPA